MIQTLLLAKTIPAAIFHKMAGQVRITAEMQMYVTCQGPELAIPFKAGDFPTPVGQAVSFRDAGNLGSDFRVMEFMPPGLGSGRPQQAVCL